MIIIYGIPNCDTRKKARRWLEANGVEYDFHDYKKRGVPEKNLKAWVKQAGWETILNKRGTTWRKLPEADRLDVTQNSTTALMLENPTLIKRPVFDTGNEFMVGFSAAEQTSLKQAG